MEIDVEIGLGTQIDTRILQHLDSLQDGICVVQSVECEMPVVERGKFSDPCCYSSVQQSDVQSLIEIDGQPFVQDPIRDLEEPFTIEQDVVVKQHHSFVRWVVELGRVLNHSEMTLLLRDNTEMAPSVASTGGKADVNITSRVEGIVGHHELDLLWKSLLEVICPVRNDAV